MIVTALYVAAGVLAVLIPVVACAKYLEWRAWDADRRIQRLRDRRKGVRHHASAQGTKGDAVQLPIVEYLP